MASVRASFLLFLALLLLSFNNIGSTTETKRERKTWCVAKPSSNDRTLKANLDYACAHVDCGDLQKGNACFEPDTLMNHASVAMNLYYQAMGRNPWNCVFQSSDFPINGIVVITDPSYGNCLYA